MRTHTQPPVCAFLLIPAHSRMINRRLNGSPTTIRCLDSYPSARKYSLARCPMLSADPMSICRIFSVMAADSLSMISFLKPSLFAISNSSVSFSAFMISESEGEMVANEATNENLKDRHFKKRYFFLQSNRLKRQPNIKAGELEMLFSSFS